MGKTESNPFIVSDKTCKGCYYYGHLSGGFGCRCCDYTFLTGKLKPEGEPCAQCSVKLITKKKRSRSPQALSKL